MTSQVLFDKNTFCALPFSVCQLASSFDKTLPLIRWAIQYPIIDSTDTNLSMSHLLMCVTSCGLVGVGWVSLDADICASAASATRTTLLFMLISGLQCDSEDGATHC